MGRYRYTTLTSDKPRRFTTSRGQAALTHEAAERGMKFPTTYQIDCSALRYRVILPAVSEWREGVADYL